MLTRHVRSKTTRNNNYTRYRISCQNYEIQPYAKNFVNSESVRPHKFFKEYSAATMRVRTFAAIVFGVGCIVTGAMLVASFDNIFNYVFESVS